MAGGAPTAAKVEIELDSGTWTDVSAAVNWNLGWEIYRGGSDSIETPTVASTLALALDNITDPATGIAPYTPDSPLGVYYPRLTRGKRIRVSMTKGSTWVRFSGWITAITPEWPDGQTRRGLVRITATDIIGMLATIEVRTPYVTEARYNFRRVDVDAGDVWDFDAAETSTRWPNQGIDSSLHLLDDDTLDAYVVKANSKAGQAGVTSAEGQVTFTAAVNLTRGTDKTGPVIVLPGQNKTFQTFGMFWRVDGTDPGTTFRDMASAWTSAGVCIWRMGLVVSSSSPRLELRSADLSTLIATTAIDRAIDGKWHYAYVVANGSDVALGDEDSVNWGSASLDSTGVRTVVVGGYMRPSVPGTQVNCLAMQVGPCHISHDITGYYAAAGYREAVDAGAYAWSEHLLAEPEVAALITKSTRTYDSGDSSMRGVTLPQASRRTVLEALVEVVHPAGGCIIGAPTGKYTVRWSDLMRPVTPALTLTAETDDDASGPIEWVMAASSQPAKVTVAWTGGEVSATSTDEGRTGEATIASILDTKTAARALAWAFVRAGGRLRPGTLTLDLVHAGTDLWSAAAALLVGDRVRLDGIPGGVFGVTRWDLYIREWTETYRIVDGRPSYTLAIGVDAADDPPEAAADSTTYARTAAGDGVATVTGGTCVGTTATGTVVVTSTAPWSTTAGDYPMDLDWAGESITVAAPGGATSPQTFTVTSRAANGTVARSHVAGETVDLWMAARVAR